MSGTFDRPAVSLHAGAAVRTAGPLACALLAAACAPWVVDERVYPCDQVIAIEVEQSVVVVDEERSRPRDGCFVEVRNLRDHALTDGVLTGTGLTVISSDPSLVLVLTDSSLDYEADGRDIEVEEVAELRFDPLTEDLVVLGNDGDLRLRGRFDDVIVTTPGNDDGGNLSDRFGDGLALDFAGSVDTLGAGVRRVRQLRLTEVASVVSIEAAQNVSMEIPVWPRYTGGLGAAELRGVKVATDGGITDPILLVWATDWIEVEALSDTSRPPTAQINPGTTKSYLVPSDTGATADTGSGSSGGTGTTPQPVGRVDVSCDDGGGVTLEAPGVPGATEAWIFAYNAIAEGAFEGHPMLPDAVSSRVELDRTGEYVPGYETSYGCSSSGFLGDDLAYVVLHADASGVIHCLLDGDLADGLLDKVIELDQHELSAGMCEGGR